jgi:hypothetical protein
MNVYAEWNEKRNGWLLMRERGKIRHTFYDPNTRVLLIWPTIQEARTWLEKNHPALRFVESENTK